MNFFDLSNLLDSDGNLQNEMLVFAFAATLLSTIPILLGNEFDVNVGLRRKKRSFNGGETFKLFESLEPLLDLGRDRKRSNEIESKPKKESSWSPLIMKVNQLLAWSKDQVNESVDLNSSLLRIVSKKIDRQHIPSDDFVRFLVQYLKQGGNTLDSGHY